MNETSDSELLMLIKENNEDALYYLNARYQTLFKSIIRKNSSILKTLKIDYNEAYNVCLKAFDESINSYYDDKNVSFNTYITVLVNRYLKKYMVAKGRKKNKILNEAISLDYVYSKLNLSLEEMIGDNISDPLYTITKEENIKELQKVIKKNLSDLEYTVILLMVNNLNYQQIAKLLNKTPKQIDNTIQRIRNKLKKQILTIYA